MEELVRFLLRAAENLRTNGKLKKKRLDEILESIVEFDRVGTKIFCQVRLFYSYTLFV